MDYLVNCGAFGKEDDEKDSMPVQMAALELRSDGSVPSWKAEVSEIACETDARTHADARPDGPACDGDAGDVACAIWDSGLHHQLDALCRVDGQVSAARLPAEADQREA